MTYAKFTLTIGDETFNSGDHVTTPDGAGVLISADPFADEDFQFLVQNDQTRVFKWYSYLVIQIVQDDPPVLSDELPGHLLSLPRQVRA